MGFGSARPGPALRGHRRGGGLVEAPPSRAARTPSAASSWEVGAAGAGCSRGGCPQFNRET